MLNEEQVIDVTSEEVVEETEQVVDEQPVFAETFADAYKQYKQTKYKMKKLREQVQNNIKAQRGFGYTHKDITYET